MTKSYLDDLPGGPLGDALAHGDLLRHRNLPPHRVAIVLRAYQFLPDLGELAHPLGQDVQLDAPVLVLVEDVAHTHHGVFIVEARGTGDEAVDEEAVVLAGVQALVYAGQQVQLQRPEK